jgi:hypothetical protein
MSKQSNKVEKRKRRQRYLKRRKDREKSKKGVTAPAAASA